MRLKLPKPAAGGAPSADAASLEHLLATVPWPSPDDLQSVSDPAGPLGHKSGGETAAAGRGEEMLKERVLTTTEHQGTKPNNGHRKAQACYLSIFILS